jgi:hypothetical protein
VKAHAGSELIAVSANRKPPFWRIRANTRRSRGDPRAPPQAGVVNGDEGPVLAASCLAEA